MLAAAALLALLAVPAAAFETGEEIRGFSVVETGSFDLVGAQTVLLEHGKTGAQVLLVLNDDVNRAFELTFVTPPEDDTGMTHIFEHSTLSGSEKYPSEELFFNLIYQTYNTYMNASTYPNMTTYPVASLSEAQLLRYADLYVDSCLNPMVEREEAIFRREAWRYELTDAQGPLTIAGTVYSEMLGSFTIDRVAPLNLYRTMFPGTPLGYCSGGDPAHIPELTWEQMVSYHERYYHPSNSLATLYGDIEDPEAFLALLDGYYSAYDRADFSGQWPGEPIAESTRQVFEFAVEADVDTQKAAVIYYGIMTPGATQEEIDALDLLTSLLNDSSSVMTENLRAALPAATVTASIDFELPEPTVIFAARGVDEEDADTLVETIAASLGQVAEEGFPGEMLEAVMASVEMEIRLTSESSSIGTALMPAIAYFWAATGDVHAYEKNIDNLGNFKVFADEGRYADVIGRHLLADDAITATVITKPAPGLREEQDAALAAELAEILEVMTDEEKELLIAQTMRSDELVGEPAAQYVAQLQAVTVDSLPEEIRAYEIADETGEDGVRRIDVRANVDGIGRAYMLLDASALSQEELHWFKLYVDLLGEIDTGAHTRAEMMNLLSRYMYAPEVRVSVVKAEERPQGFAPYLGLRFTAFDDDMETAYGLMGELLFDTRFEDAQAVRDVIARLRVGLRQSIDTGSYSLQINRAQGAFDPMIAYYNYVTALDYYAFLTEADALLESEPEEGLAKLCGVQERLASRANAVSIYAGTNAQAHREAADAFLAGLSEVGGEPQRYELPEVARAEALVINSAANFNLRYATLEQLGIESFSGELDVMTSLVADALLYPILRNQLGAYSVLHGVNEKGMYLETYADPNIEETFEVYDMLADLVAQLSEEIDQETLDGYILSTYSGYAMPSGELSGAVSAALDVLSGDDPARVLDWMREMKGMTPESLADYAAFYRALVENGILSTSGSQSAIDAECERYDAVLVP